MGSLEVVLQLSSMANGQGAMCSSTWRLACEAQALSARGEWKIVSQVVVSEVGTPKPVVSLFEMTSPPFSETSK